MQMHKSASTTLAAISLTILAGLFSTSAHSALQPLTCGDLQNARQSAIDKKKEAIDNLEEYEDIFDKMVSKSECIVNMNEALSARVGSGSGVLGAISSMAMDHLSEKACAQAAAMASEAKKNAKDAVTGAVQGAQDELYESLGGIGGIQDKIGSLNDIYKQVQTEQNRLKEFYAQMQERYPGQMPSLPGGGNIFNPDNPFANIQVPDAEKSIFDLLSGAH